MHWINQQTDTFQLVCDAPNLTRATLLASLGFRVTESEALREDVSLHLKDGEVYTITEREKPVGFGIIDRYPGGILYLHGIMLMPEVQGRGLARWLIRQICMPDDRYLALRTQSPVMWAAGHRICDGKWLPHPHQGDAELSEIGRQVAEKIKTQYPVHVGFYGSALYGEKPIHQDTQIQEWWDSLCDFSRGDAIVCVGRL
jgi:GNAT superfamily N-acetyltransferase